MLHHMANDLCSSRILQYVILMTQHRLLSDVSDSVAAPCSPSLYKNFVGSHPRIALVLRTVFRRREAVEVEQQKYAGMLESYSYEIEANGDMKEPSRREVPSAVEIRIADLSDERCAAHERILGNYQPDETATQMVYKEGSVLQLPKRPRWK